MSQLNGVVKTRIDIEGIKVGGSLDSGNSASQAPNITLSADGSASFKSSSNGVIQIDCGDSSASVLDFTQKDNRRAVVRRLDSGEFDIVNKFGDVRFWTANNGTEKVHVTIDSSGNVLIGDDLSADPPNISLNADGSATFAEVGVGGARDTGDPLTLLLKVTLFRPELIQIANVFMLQP